MCAMHWGSDECEKYELSALFNCAKLMLMMAKTLTQQARTVEQENTRNTHGRKTRKNDLITPRC